MAINVTLTIGQAHQLHLGVFYSLVIFTITPCPIKMQSYMAKKAGVKKQIGRHLDSINDKFGGEESEPSRRRPSNMKGTL